MPKDPHFDIERDLARQTARHWRPQQYGKFTGQVITASDSYVLKKVESIEAQIGQIGVRSASGDWADWVPAGKVGVIGQRIIGCDRLGFTQYDGPDFKGLCDAASYDYGRPVNTFAALGVELLA